MAGRQADVWGFYRSRVESQTAAASNGLGDRADVNDAEVAHAHVASASRRVRVAALRLLAGIGRPADGALFVARFVDGTGKERREALVGLRRSGVMRSAIEDVWLQAMGRGDRVTKERVLYQLLPLAERWQRLDVGLQAVADEDPSISDAGVEVLHRTLVDRNRGYRGEPTVGPALLRRHFDAARPALLAAKRSSFSNHFVAMVESLIPTE